MIIVVQQTKPVVVESDPRVIVAGSTGLQGPIPVDVSRWVAGALSDGVVDRFLVPRAGAWSSAGARCETPPSRGAMTLTLAVNGAGAVAWVWKAGEQEPGAATGLPVSVDAGDVVALTASGSADAEDLTYYLAGEAT